MKSISLFLIALALLISAGIANAQSTSYDTVMATSKPTSGYDNGFFIGSENGDYKITIGGRVDPMFYWQSSKVPNDPTTATLNESLDTLTFRLRRAQMWVTPSFNNFKLFILVGHGTSTNRTAGTQGTYWAGTATYKLNKNFSLDAGYFDPGYDLMSLTSSKRMTMVDPPITLTQQDGEQTVWNFTGDRTVARPSFGLPTQLGIMLSANAIDGRLNGYLSVGNGNEGDQRISSNRQLTYVGRVSYNILGDDPYGDMTDYAYSEIPSLAVGLGGAFEHDDGYAPNAAGVTVKMYNYRLDATADVAFKYRGLALNLVGYGSKLKVGPGAVWEAGEKYLDDVGYLATVAMFAIPKRLEFQAWGAQIIREGADNDVYEFGGGMNIYLKGHNAQFMVDYSRVLDYDDVIGSNHGRTNRIRARMQTYF